MSIRLARESLRISSESNPGEKNSCKHPGVPGRNRSPDPMNLMLTEDLNQEKLKWLIEHVGEMIPDPDEYENET